MAKQRREENLAFWSARRGDVRMLEELARKHPDCWESCLSYAVEGALEGRQMEVIGLLERHGVDFRDCNSWLLTSVSYDWAELADLMLDRGADIEARDHRRNTPLLRAAWQGNQRMVRFLLDRGADPLVCDEIGQSALHFAAQNSDADVLLLLLPHGLDVNQREAKYGYAPLHVVDSAGRVGASPIQCRRAVRLLLRHGADIEAPDDGGDTPLCAAADLDRPVVVEELIRAGASVNARGVCDRTPLHFAALSGRSSNVKRLIAAGANPNTEDQWGNTPLHCAWVAEIVVLLLDAGADVNHMDEDGNTPLHCVAEAGSHEEARLLIAAGADIDAQNSKKQSPADVAMEHGYYQLAEAIRAPNRNSVKDE
jgi:cytohesin